MENLQENSAGINDDVSLFSQILRRRKVQLKRLIEAHVEF